MQWATAPFKRRTSQAGTSLPHFFDGSTYKKGSQQIIDIINRLHDLGAQCSVDLPRLVVVGNQSAGKTSVMERLCDVRLPKAAKTCTACPMEVRMCTAGEWRCSIKLRIEYDQQQHRLLEVQELPFCTVKTARKDQLHVFVSAAQKALLNPAVSHSVYAQAASAALETMAVPDITSETAASEADAAHGLDHLQLTDRLSTASPSDILTASNVLKFSRNVVVLEISGANVDLTLIDLPGIIQSDQGGDDNVELVQQLVREYMKQERAIIVAVITCKDDIENQQVVQLAKEADPSGRRTIGVLTKADTIEAGTHDTWLNVLRNEHFALNLGYYCAVNPTQAELNQQMTLDEAAVKERGFFSISPVFKAQAAGVKARLGVDALRTALSKQLLDSEKELTTTRDKLAFCQQKQRLDRMLTLHAAGPGFYDYDENKLRAVNEPSMLPKVEQATRQLQECGPNPDLIHIVAGALTYYHISSRRMIDNVDRTIKFNLLAAYQCRVAQLPYELLFRIPPTTASCCNNLLNMPLAQTASNSQDSSMFSAAVAELDGGHADGQQVASSSSSIDIDGLMQEDHDVAAQRRDLQGRKEQLMQVQSLLLSI